MNKREKIRNDIIDKIIKNTPENATATKYIMEILGISRVSAYRRMKGLIPFTYEEIILLAREMDFSLDEEIELDSRRKYIIEFGNYFYDEVSDIIFKALHRYYTHLSINQKMKKVINFETTNNLWFVYTLFSDNLFKFFYYKYFQQYHIPSLKLKMKDIKIPDSILDIKKEIVDVIVNTHNRTTICIVDRNIFFNTINEIQYYYRRGLLDNQELKSIANDIKHLLTDLEKGAIEDVYDGRQYQYYLGMRNIYSNTSYIQNDKQSYSFFYQDNLHPMICYDQQMCELHHNYLQAHKRQSALISGSNEELQIDFFEKQYGYIENLVEDKDLIVC
ncbi:helix-turn-helix domain-containing protein [Prevotella sp. 10(H)]|uniref:helix-turn-helix domain-containing protein n=1 Tax=Prevotella sp. 10(H) TaxID=1158294 RepID=UPI0004A708E0|nr:helix-turn-helix domain-containing protein [Prevotella sp. 10(H)]